MLSPKVSPKSSPRPLQELLGDMMAGPWGQTNSWRSKQSLCKALGLALGSTRSDQVSYAMLEDLVATWRTEGLSAATINRRLSALRSALVLDYKRGVIPGVPPMPNQREDNLREGYFTKDQEQRLIEALGGLESPYGSLVAFLVDTGARLGEALAITQEDLQPGYVILRNTKSTRGGFKARQVPLTKRAQEAGARVAGARYASSSAVSHRIACALRKAGVSGLTTHSLRHTCASRLLNNGASLVEVRDWLGHTSVSVTERYAHLEQGKLNHLINKLEA